MHPLPESAAVAATAYTSPGGVAFRRLRIPDDIPMIHGWFQQPHAAFWCLQGATVAEVRALLPESAVVRLSDLAPKRVLLFATKEHHCLADLLIRHEYGELNARLLAVVSNHQALAPLVGKFGLPFHFHGHDGLTREAHEADLLRLAATYQPDFLVLAKYMRVLTPAFVAHYPSRIINIHHSFLPAFMGAQPYHRAWERGVKLIGATAHYVTEELDAGPIIAQSTVNVSHRDEVEDLIRKGRDTERLALARAVRLHLKRQVMVYRGRTAVFE